VLAKIALVGQIPPCGVARAALYFMHDPTLTALSRVLALKQHDGVASTYIPADWTQGRTTFGGLLAAIAIRALQADIPEERALRSFSMDCVAPAGVGPLDVSTEVLRVGKSLSHARATLSQDGKTCAVLLGVFGQPLRSQLHVRGASAPAWSKPAEEVPRLPYLPGITPAFTQHFDYRWTSEQPIFSGAARGQIGAYVRALDADVLDAALIAALIDSFPPPVLLQLSKPAPASTVTWLVNLIEPPAQSSPAEFCRYESVTNSAHAGFASFDARLWDASGTLLADSRQLVVEFS